MKTNSQKITRFLNGILIIVLFIMSSSAQAGGPAELSGIKIKTNLTGDGLGGNICPSIEFRVRDYYFGIGPNIQTLNRKISGLQLNGSYFVTENRYSKISLYFFATSIYNKSANFCRNTIELEKEKEFDKCTNFRNVKVSTVELYGGFGIKIRHGGHFSTRYSIGAGGYYTLNKKELSHTYRDNTGGSLLLNWSLSYDF